MSDLHPLARAVSHPSPGKDKLPPWRAIASLTLAPAAFSLQVVASYVVASNGCEAGTGPSGWLTAINILAFALTASGVGIAIAQFRATRDEKEGDHKRTQEIGEGRTRFLAYCGICASAIFGLAVIVQFTALLTLPGCIGFASFS